MVNLQLCGNISTVPREKTTAPAKKTTAARKNRHLREKKVSSCVHRSKPEVFPYRNTLLSWRTVNNWGKLDWQSWHGNLRGDCPVSWFDPAWKIDITRFDFSAGVQLTVSFLSRFLATVCAGVCMLFGFLLYKGCAAGFHKVTRMHTGTALDRGGKKMRSSLTRWFPDRCQEELT